MGLTKDQQIYAAIDLLKHHGYKVYKDYSMLIGMRLKRITLDYFHLTEGISWLVRMYSIN